MERRGQSPALGSAVAGLEGTMAALEGLGARQDYRLLLPPASCSQGITAVTSSVGVVSQAAVSVRDAAKGVREVAQRLLSSLTPEREMTPGGGSDEEDDFGYEEEQSMGIDLPLGPDPTSGTPYLSRP